MDGASCVSIFATALRIDLQRKQKSSPKWHFLHIYCDGSPARITPWGDEELNIIRNNSSPDIFFLNFNLDEFH